MAHEIIAREYSKGNKIRGKNWQKENYFYRVQHAGGWFEVKFNWRGNTVPNLEGIIDRLLTSPEDFELYQEPKKPWIYTNDFVAKEFPILNDNSRSGAIALAREFLKRLENKIPNDDHATYIKLLNKSIFKDLVGEDNLK